MRKQILRNALQLLMVALILTGCGKSGGDDGTTTPEDTTATESSISLALVNATTGSETTTLSITEPANVIATITDTVGAPVEGAVVTFTTTLASFNPPGGSGLTDAAGQVVIGLVAGNTGGAAQVTATAVVDGAAASTSIGYQVETANLQLGSGTPFVANVAEIGTSPLSAGGTSTVSVTLVGENGQPFTTPIDVSFSSPCTSSGDATLDTPVTTLNGTATTVYQASGCVGTDTVTAIASIGGQNLVATGSIDVLSANLGSIEFVSTSQNLIALRGTGGVGLSEQASLTFRVRDNLGNPVASQAVDFVLNTNIGGLNLDPVSATSNSLGEVQTTVNSGTIATPVRVTASLPGTAPVIQTQSDLLIVTTGIPDQDSISVSAETLNVEAFGVDGVQVPVTARLADRFNNPVPDGTAVTFTTEGGSIGSGCATLNGACTVTWTSQDPRPVTRPDDPVPGDLPGGFPFLGRGGRSTVTAIAIGEESFVDLNGNGVFDDPDDFTGQDLPEAFRDFDEDGVRDSAFEPFFDFDGDNNFDGADGLFNGVLCSHSTQCPAGTPTSLHVRDDITIVMSTSGAIIEVSPGPIISIPKDGAAAELILVWDGNGNNMPAGTTIATSISGDAASISGTSSSIVPNTALVGPHAFSIVIEAGDEAGSALLSVDVTSPGEVTTTGSFTVTVTP